MVYVDWEEILISNEKGKREVHYFLKRKEGLVRDLAVIGKEKTIRHMFYTIALSNPPLLKLKSRREVLDWLSSIVSGTIFIHFYLFIFHFTVHEIFDLSFLVCSTTFYLCNLEMR